VNSLPVAELRFEELMVFAEMLPPTVAVEGTSTSMVSVHTPGLLPEPATTPKLVILKEVEVPTVEETVPPVQPLSMV